MNLSKFLSLLILILASSCAYDLDDNLSVIPRLETQEAIAADSDLFDNLKDIASNDEQPDKSIVCIDFIYPITLFVFDENDEYLYTSGISDDDEFSAFLEPIEETYSISISFPITSILDSGEELSIDTKEELKEAIDSCLNIEMVGECETLIRDCVWKVGYSFIDDNPYLGSIIQETDGFTTFNIDNDLSIGSWTPFTIENELHINISLNDTTAIGDYFNSDWKVQYIDANSLRLKHQDRELILNQRCDPNFTDCENFNFEACETELDSGIAEFTLEDYTFCILDTLEFEQDEESEDINYQISYYETEEDAIAMANSIPSEDIYTTTETNQSLYVRIDDIENDLQYYVLISLSAIGC